MYEHRKHGLFIHLLSTNHRYIHSNVKKFNSQFLRENYQITCYTFKLYKLINPTQLNTVIIYYYLIIYAI